MSRTTHTVLTHVTKYSTPAIRCHQTMSLWRQHKNTCLSMLYVTDHSTHDAWVETFLHTSLFRSNNLVHVSKSESFSAYATFLYTRKHACKAPHVHKHVFSIPNVHVGFIPRGVWHAGTEPPAFHLAGELLNSPSGELENVMMML